jgi:hypothetical protein
VIVALQINLNDPTPTLPLEGREQVCGRLIKFSIYYGQFLKLLHEKKANFLVNLPPPIQGEGRGGVTCKNEKSRLSLLSVLMIPTFIGRKLLNKTRISCSGILSFRLNDGQLHLFGFE